MAINTYVRHDLELLCYIPPSCTCLYHRIGDIPRLEQTADPPSLSHTEISRTNEKADYTSELVSAAMSRNIRVFLCCLMLGFSIVFVGSRETDVEVLRASRSSTGSSVSDLTSLKLEMTVNGTYSCEFI